MPKPVAYLWPGRCICISIHQALILSHDFEALDRWRKKVRGIFKSVGVSYVDPDHGTHKGTDYFGESAIDRRARPLLLVAAIEFVDFRNYSDRG